MRTIYAILLLSVVTATGCTHGFGFLDNAERRPPVQAATPQPPPEPVTADQVSAANAHRSAKALQEEMDRAARE